MLLGRDLERQTLEGLLEEARGGRSAVLALVGEAGIGKSTLLDWVASSADTALVLRARGIQSEAHVPFAGLFELLRPALDRLDAIPAPQAAALETALALRPGRTENRFAVGAATLSLLAAKADEGPLVVLVDDVHWLDGSSADALLFAVRRLLADPIAVVLSAREGEPSLLDGSDLPVLHVQGLGDEPSIELLRTELPGMGPEALSRLLREAGGNPLALLELAREGGPELGHDAPPPVVTTVAHSFLQRASALPERTRQALVLAAATDRGDLALFARAAANLDLGPDDLTSAEQARLLATRDGRIEFRHPVARSAIYGDADVEWRRSVHRALSTALPDADADRRAWHLALASVGPDETASSALAQAAARAHNRSAYEVSSSTYERAARLAPAERERGKLLYDAADTAWLGGQPERALTLLDEINTGVPSYLVSCLRGEIGLRRGPLNEAKGLLVAAAEEAALDAPERAVAILAEASIGAFYEADGATLLHCGVRAAAIAETLDSPRTSFLARMTEGIALVLLGEGERGAGLIREASDLVESSATLAADVRLLPWTAVAPLFLREAGSGRRLAARAAAAARDHAAVSILPHVLLYVATEQGAADEWSEAEAGFDEAARLARETGQRVVLAGALARLGRVEARRGREQAARRHTNEALALAREVEAVVCEIWALTGLVELELVLGKVEAALAAVDALRTAIEGKQVEDVDLFPEPEAVELLLRAGRHDETRSLVERYSTAADVKGQPWALARAARTRGLVAGDDAFSAEFEGALELHDRTPDVFERARTLLTYGARLRRAGRRTEARERLRAALELFDDLGAGPWGELARAELAATGETARRREAATLDELTPQELQISLLLAEGKTTREAAAALFLSPKTIEYHLRNAYRKLAIHSRDELREALAGKVGVTGSSPTERGPR
jgi:DNA-binding CsgD family transcriptional regulator